MAPFRRTDVARRPIEIVGYPSVPAAPSGRLANGLVVDASILARLLGLRLLKLDAHITLVPVDSVVRRSTTSPAPVSAPVSAPPRGLHDAIDVLARARHTLELVNRP